ncbi:PARP-domain-containing protein [Tothia fuscella]|uniref:Poly [ADP-ribose] polymerase n=1 Tax=Tothia fuscella TaxID=1048955 RepID=A0A9P4NZH2_9PEZI|nr:PARP-domain-containing protein [Tothia fuscella]
MKKQKTDAQVLKTPNLAIPVDEHSPYSATHRVYIAPDGVVYDASLNQTNIGANNNKFYRIQLLVGRSGYDHVVWTRWGRVGDRGQSKPLDADSLEGAMSDYNSKFKAKTGLAWEARNDPPHKNKYTFIERSYEPDSSELEGDDDDMDGLPGAGSRRGSKHSATSQAASKLEEPVQKLMQLIFSQHLFNEVMAEMNYDPQKLPLGKLSKRTISQGYEHLKQLAHLIMNPGTGTTADGDTVVDLTNAYLSVVPHAFGRNKPQPITTQQALKREIELLESLSDMKIAEDLMAEAKVVDNTTHPIDRQYNGLGLKEMTPLNHKSVEYKELEQYLLKTKGETHSVGYKIEDIFRIERDGEFERFNSSPYGPLAQDRRLLWHGSRTTNFGGILSQGLRIAPPEAPVSGYMFDKGVYLADMSSKSANYCNAHSSDGIGLLLLCEAELGKPMLELEQSNYDAAALCKKNGSIATWGKGTNGPLKWKDAKCLHPSLKGTTMPDVSIAPGNTGVGDKSKVGWGNLYYNEYIAYDVAQIRLRYLFRVQMGSEY